MSAQVPLNHFCGNALLIEEDISALEQLLLDPEGLMVPVPFAELNAFSQNQISLFCWKHAVYQVITTELVDFVREQINGFSAIEIGAGNGCLGRALHIPLTDSRQQERADIQAYYRRLKQPVISYPSDIETMDALWAIKKYQANCAVGSWVTQKYKTGMKDGNAWGVDGAVLAARLKRYVFIGNEHRHQSQDVLRYCRPTAYKFDWLVSRSLERAGNVIWIFDFKIR